MLLEVVANAWDVGGDFHLVGELHAGDLSKSGVRLLRGHRAHDQADTTLHRGALCGLLTLLDAVPVLAERRGFDLRDLRLATLSNELTNRRHGVRALLLYSIPRLA